MLFGSNVLDFAIGMVLVYLLLSMICSYVNERITSWLNLRANGLIFGIHGMIGEYTAALFNHPLITSLGKQGGRDAGTPSYIPSQNFALALIDTIVTQHGILQGFTDLEKAINTIADPNESKALLKRLLSAKALAIGAVQPVKSVHRTGFFKYLPDRSPRIRPVHVETYSGVHIDYGAAADAVDAIKTELQGLVAIGTLKQLNTEAVDKLITNLKLAVSDPDKVPAVKLVDFTVLTEAIGNIQDASLKRALLPLLASAQNSIDRFQINVQDWFNGAMDRLTGWYKRRTFWIILTIAVVVTVALNGDSFAIGNSLWHNEGQRTASIAAAQKLLSASTPVPGQPAPTAAAGQPAPAPTGVQLRSEDATNIYNQVKTLQVPIGYTTTAPATGKHVPWFGSAWRVINFGDDWEAWFLKAVGWIVTAFALTLGAHFWFDTLGSLMNLRYAGAPPQGTPNVATSGPPPIPPGGQGGGTLAGGSVPASAQADASKEAGADTGGSQTGGTTGQSNATP